MDTKGDDSKRVPGCNERDGIVGQREPAKPIHERSWIGGTIKTAGGDLEVKITGTIGIVRGVVIRTEYGEVVWSCPIAS